jgi:hypothetical protein
MLLALRSDAKTILERPDQALRLTQGTPMASNEQLSSEIVEEQHIRASGR